jgi:Flp pilus assembly protein TadG
VLVIFAAALPALFGFLGLALDGGYYLAATQAAQFAASAAARAAALDVQVGSYSSATADGQAIGQRNLSLLGGAGTTIAIAYNNTASASPSGAGWYTTTPSAQTRSVRATVSSSYRTLFLQLVGVSTADVSRASVVTRGGGTVVPLAVCASEMASRPNGTWTIWDDRGGLCSVSSWDGLVDLNGTGITGGCGAYQDWILPAPPSGPVPSDGTRMTLDTRRCQQVENWLQTYSSTNLVQRILVLDTANGNVVKGCRMVRLDPSQNGFVRATPTAAMESCGGLEETS